MTLISPRGMPVEIYCDGCGYVWEHHHSNLRNALAEMKKANWTIKSYVNKEGIRKWRHQCGLCNGKNEVNPRGLPR